MNWWNSGPELVGPDLVRVPVPMPEDGLRANNAYLLGGESGVSVIDPGLRSREAYSALNGGLSLLGAGLGDMDLSLSRTPIGTTTRWRCNFVASAMGEYSSAIMSGQASKAYRLKADRGEATSSAGFSKLARHWTSSKPCATMTSLSTSLTGKIQTTGSSTDR